MHNFAAKLTYLLNILFTLVVSLVGGKQENFWLIGPGVFN